MAEAWHHRSDALSSIGSFIGIFGARLGYPVLDPVASVVIACFILKVAYDIFKETLDRMVDHACDAKTPAFSICAFFTLIPSVLPKFLTTIKVLRPTKKRPQNFLLNFFENRDTITEAVENLDMC